ncbi:MAG: hypothetical protein G4V63_12820, partial [Candidatus Afipia apatlaquensis]|nr:hypothetical protein [Candidatus Afipia apatlaquensis]
GRSKLSFYCGYFIALARDGADECLDSFLQIDVHFATMLIAVPIRKQSDPAM